MEPIKNVKGTHDIIESEANAFLATEGIMKSIAAMFAFNEVRPPVMEYSEVFSRGVGESSDVVRKEMYTFLDKGGRSVTLRPEFTAGITRLVIQNKLYATSELPLKLYYCGPVFRYERPQLGRYREFNQFGVESIGKDSPYVDAEVISLAYSILVSLGIDNLTLKLNTLGDKESRDNYRSALKDYFKDHIANMCEDCKNRYELNPLRILDCKVPDDRPIIDKAPRISDYLSEASKTRFEQLKAALDELDIPYEVDDSLVRGLDYYSETVFEFHYQSLQGNDYGAVGAGGHYGSLMKELNGPDYPGVGFSFGIERIVSVMKEEGLFPDLSNYVDIYVMPMNDNVRSYALNIAYALRSNGFYVDMCFDNTKMGNMFKRATNKKAKFAVIIGEDEKENNTVVVKDLEKQEQITLSLEELMEHLDAKLGERECTCGYCQQNGGN